MGRSVSFPASAELGHPIALREVPIPVYSFVPSGRGVEPPLHRDVLGPDLEATVGRELDNVLAPRIGQS